MVIPPHCDVLIPIALSPGFPAGQTLLFSPHPFIDLPRELHGRFPSTLLYNTTPALLFSNLCGSPMRLRKGDIVGTAQLLSANTKMTFFASADGGTTDPDTLPADPFGLTADISVDEHHVEHVTIPIDEYDRPCPDCDHLTVAIDKGLSDSMKSQLTSLLRRFAGCFAFGGRRLGKVDMPPMSMDVTDSSRVPHRASPYRESPRTSKLIADSMRTLRELDIIEPGCGPIASPVVMVLQKGKYGFCVDFRGINSVTPMDRYPIPRPDSVCAALSGAQFFSTMDANKGYHQFELSPASRWLSAFSTEKEGQWQYKRVPFGLQNAPAFFQRSIDSLLGRWRWQFVLAYIDDVVVWSPSWSDHLDHLSKILAAFQRVNLTLDERKCNFGFSSIDLLGLRVSRLGLRTLTQKTEAIRALPFPSTVKHLRQILGQFSYYRQFIPRFASIAAPLTSALKVADKIFLTGLDAKQHSRQMGKQAVEPTPERLAALDELKSLLSSAPVLRHPDFKKPFFLYTDASLVGIGAALHQEDAEQRQCPVLFISRSLTPAEKHYSATELEYLGVYWSFTKLSHYLDGSSVTIVTDHHALQWLWSIKQSTNSRLHKWAMLLGPMEHTLKIVHRPGLTHSNVDPLSRHPIQRTVLSGTSESAHPSVPSCLVPDLLARIRLSYADDETFGGYVSPFNDESYHWDDGLLYYLHRLCIPLSCRIDVIRLLHDEMGHPGTKRTLAKAIERVYWPCMSRDIGLYCRSCHNCQVVKTDTSRKPGILQPISAVAPFHTFCIDFVEGLPPCGGLDSLCTLTDKYTKAIRLLPCKKADSAPQFAIRFFHSIFPSWGVPHVIISDWDRRFTSGFWGTLLSLTGTKLSMTTAYHPQADGQSERTNRTVNATLRIMVLESQRRWIDLLPAIEFAHNSCINLSSGYAPFDRLHGCSPHGFGDLVSRPLAAPRHSVGAEEMAAALTTHRKDAEHAMLRAQELQKKYYDGNHSPISFLPGDLACLHYHRRGKLDPIAQVVQVLEVVSPVSYRIKVPPGSRMHDVVSVEHLRKYTSRDAPVPLPTSCIPDSAVTRVLGKRMWGGRCEILCLRDGEDESDAVWDDVSLLDDHSLLLREFRERWAAWTTPAIPSRPLPAALGAPPRSPSPAAPPGPRRSGRIRRPSQRVTH